jgi:hypothetical protein
MEIKMNKIILTIATLAALSSSALAFQNRSQDLRDVEPFASESALVSIGSLDASSLAVVDSGKANNAAIDELYDSHGQRR